MIKSRFLINFTWELKNLFRFPFPEVLLALFTYLVFLPRVSISSWNWTLGDVSWTNVTLYLGRQSAYSGALYSVEAYLPLTIFASIFSTLAFAYEIENGLLKVHFSHPTSRVTIFLSKWLSCFLIVFSTLSCTLLFFTFLYLPENSLYLITNSYLPLGLLLLAASETFFVVSLTVAFSIFSRKTSVSLVGSFATLYIIQLLSETANLPFLPPISFRAQAGFLFSRVGSILPQFANFMTIPIVSAVLTLVSCIYFLRRLELS